MKPEPLRELPGACHRTSPRMRAPRNRRVFIIGRAARTPLGDSAAATWQHACANQSGLRLLSRCDVGAPTIVGEIPGREAARYPFDTAKERHNWNAAYVLETMAVCQDALADARLPLDGSGDIGPRTACLIGSAIGGADSLRAAFVRYGSVGANGISPYLLPNICANVPSGKAGTVLGFSGPIFSPQGACASGNHAIAIGARLLRDGDADFAVAGGVEMPLVPEIVLGFANMNASFKMHKTDRAAADPGQASRPFSVDRRGFVLAEGAAAVVLAAEDAVATHGLRPLAEVAGIGWTSDAHHFTRPHQPTIVRAIRDALDDAEIDAGAVGSVNAHGTSTPTGDAIEVACLREIFGQRLREVPITANKSQVGHALGAAAAIEAVLALMALEQQTVLPTLNYLPDPELGDADFPHQSRRHPHEHVLSNAFGFGGTNCCLVLRGV
jgi:3-oxoacyl-[acyl-carrier-protein] synthase II